MGIQNKNGRPLRVLGVDPALAGATGYGVVEVAGTRARPLDFGALKFPPRASLDARLKKIHALVARLVREFSPDAVAVESVFTALNVCTALRLAEVRGVVLLAAAQAGIPAHSYSPREVKANVAGDGTATKEQMQQMVSLELGLRERPEPPDAADALAVALCHAFQAHAQQRLAQSLSETPARMAQPVFADSQNRLKARSTGRVRLRPARI